MAKVMADDWGENMVVLSDDSLSGDEASPGSQNLPRTESCISQVSTWHHPWREMGGLVRVGFKPTCVDTGESRLAVHLSPTKMS